MSTLLECIRIIRNERHYTQELMAYELGISQTAYSYLENNNEDSLTIGRLREIAAIFNMSLIELVTMPLHNQIDHIPVLLNQQIRYTEGTLFNNMKLATNTPTIGSRIRYLREKKGLIQTNMASRMGISQKTYSLLESSDDDSQKIGRLKRVTACLSLTHWTELLPSDRLVFSVTVSKNQSDGLSNTLLSGTDETIHQRVKELEELVIRLSKSTINEAV